jgi:peptidoglycan/xylan/chitin deacetylase (PgdA/CDA1 family)
LLLVVTIESAFRRAKSAVVRSPAIARRLAGSVARWRGIVGLNYHRIGDGRRSIFDRGLYSATAEGFERQVRWLKANFDVIAPGDVAQVVRSKRGRHVLVTFDDGYADNYTAAFPILKSHALPAAFFIATGYIDEPHLPWWDEIAWMVRTSTRSSMEIPGFLAAPVSFDEPEREGAVRALLRTYKKLPDERTTDFLAAIGQATGTGRPPPEVVDLRSFWMTWDMLREMHAAGMTIGGHTVHHPVLSRLTRAEQAEEIAACERRLREELGVAMHAFAYPVGSLDAFNADSRDCLRERGVRTAFSYYGGIRRLSDWDDYDIPRIAIEQDTTFDEFRAIVMFPWAT